MYEQERIASYIATCKICLLAQNMKDCPSCNFNIGLAEKVVSISNVDEKFDKKIFAIAFAPYR
jgi:hypothetical protein